MVEEFRNKFLSETGYKPYICKICGERFWSIIPRETCPDRPCSKYEFLKKSYPRMKTLTYDEARQKFINYFIRNGHGYMDPYPVLARWRNDLYLTIASIIVFQPAVTEGVVDPPYNPLVIVQPSVRLEDIDNVGLTFGRHLTSFEMGGHHAFNKDDKKVYWVEETLRYAYEFFTKEIGVPQENLVFKESWWEGGGNAGPAYEVLVDGLEVATLVFMKYKIVDGKRELNPVLVVDTGYGIERIAWLTQRTSTAFHSIFGNLIETYKNILSIEEPPYDVLRDIVYELSDVEIKGIDHIRKLLREKGFSEYEKQLIEAVNLYTLLDHGKTIMLMLSDGIVPSNVGEGYLARLVIRRMIRTLLRLDVELHKLEDIITELLEKQALYWKGIFVYDKFHRHLDYITDVMTIETRKAIDLVNRGLRIVDKIFKKKKTITLDDLIEIYDSQGIPPEIVAKRASEKGITINVPHDFYSIIAARHGGSRALVKEKEVELPKDVKEWASGFPETRRLFHENPYQREFTGKVLGIKDKYLVLDQTIFYPKAGGQEHDTGYIFFGDEKIAVKRVHKTGNIIVHELEKEPKNKTQYVKGVIDWNRRYRLMRHHTATHIILGAARKVLGDHVWQAGAEKTLEKARLDITHYKPLTPEEIKKIEEEANRIIDNHIDLRFHMMPKFEAEKRFSLRIYQGGAVISPILRIVEIPGWDAEACFGTHVQNTSEVGGIKIIKAEKIQDGVIRLEFIASTRLPEYLADLKEKVDKSLKILGIQHGDLASAATKVKKTLDTYRELLTMYRVNMKKHIVEKAENSKVDICGLSLVILKEEINDKQLYKSVLEELSLKKEYLVIYVTDKLIEIAISPRKAKEQGLDLRRIVEKLRSIGVRGGGKPDHITLRVDDPEKIIDYIISLLREMICKK